MGGRYISYFSKTPRTLCPHFWIIKPYTGCPYNCSYCYLQGTFYGNKTPRMKDLGMVQAVLISVRVFVMGIVFVVVAVVWAALVMV